MYHVFSTGITAFIIYLLSLFFCRIGFYSLSIHRKIWNIILAIFFLGTALAGILIALQINFKWEIQYIKTILKWHVETGIGLAFTGLFHFSWHLKYFRFFFDRKPEHAIAAPEVIRNVRQNKTNLFLAGFLSSSVQLLMMREMINISGGYELVTGVFLGAWLITSATGSALARRSESTDLRLINTVLLASALISMLLMIVLSRLLFGSGETPSFLSSIFFTLIVLLPFCFSSGFAFIRLMLISAGSNKISSGQAFSVETAGGIASGLAVSVLSFGILNTYQISLTVITGYLIYLLCSFYLSGKRRRIITILAGIGIIFIINMSGPDNFFRQQLLPGVRVVKSDDSPYGNITVSEYGGEMSLLYNHRLVSWQNDEMEREENIHYAMLQHPQPRKVLLVSGDLESCLQELLKYPVSKIYYVERDPQIIRKTVPDDGTLPGIVNVENRDAYRFVKEMDDLLDVVILNLPPPSTLSINRYYTTDFFRAVKEKLANGGVFACSPGPGENYFNKESAALYSSIYMSLSTVFRNVAPVVGNKLYLLASDSTLNLSICSLVEKRKVNNVYVCSDFLSDNELVRKSGEFLDIIDKNARTNTIEVPVACFLYQSYNLTRNLSDIIPSLVIIILLFLVPVTLTGLGSGIKMYTAASALAGFEIILLLVLQSTAGNMYQFTGMVLAGFMAGLAAGAGRWIKVWKSPGSNAVLSLLTLIYLISGLLIHNMLMLENTILILLLIILISFIPSFFTGYLFNILTEDPVNPSEPGKVYSSDLAGSALGFVAISGIILPLIGIQYAIFLLSAFVFAGLLLGTIHNK